MLSFFDLMPLFISYPKNSPTNLGGSISHVIKATWITIIFVSSVVNGLVPLFADDEKKQCLL